MEAHTDIMYYDIIEKCTKEAFLCLKLIDYYPTNGTKAIWDVSAFIIIKDDGLPTESDNELSRKEYIKENMRVTFLMALDRYWKDFEIKHSITRGVFYKKCYQSLLFKISQSPLWNKPDFGIDINNPCILTFVWNMMGDIEARSIEYQQPTPEVTQRQNEINNTDAIELTNNTTETKDFYFTNNFDHVQEKKVYNYFKTELVDKNYLSLDDLHKYLVLAFQDKSIPVERFVLKGKYSIGIIKKIFYNYYNEIAQDKHGLRYNYCQLLGEYFNGFNTNKLMNNFNK